MAVKLGYLPKKAKRLWIYGKEKYSEEYMDLSGGSSTDKDKKMKNDKMQLTF